MLKQKTNAPAGKPVVKGTMYAYSVARKGALWVLRHIQITDGVVTRIEETPGDVLAIHLAKLERHVLGNR